MPYYSGYSLSNVQSLDLLLLPPWQFSHILYLDIRCYKLAANNDYYFFFATAMLTYISPTFE